MQDILPHGGARGASAYAPANVNDSTATSIGDGAGGIDSAGEGNQVDEEMPGVSVSTAAPSLPLAPVSASSKGKEHAVGPPPSRSNSTSFQQQALIHGNGQRCCRGFSRKRRVWTSLHQFINVSHQFLSKMCKPGLGNECCQV